MEPGIAPPIAAHAFDTFRGERLIRDDVTVILLKRAA